MQDGGCRTLRRKPNYNWLLANWSTVIRKLCEECSTHDVLGVFCDHLEDASVKLEHAGISPKKTQRALSKLREAMRLIDPEG